MPAEQAITFHIADASSPEGQLRALHSFKPEMCHQLFGDDEVISGMHQRAECTSSTWTQELTRVECRLHCTHCGRLAEPLDLCQPA